MWQQWERQRPATEADVKQAGESDQRKLLTGRCATRLATPGLKRTVRPATLIILLSRYKKIKTVK